MYTPINHRRTGGTDSDAGYMEPPEAFASPAQPYFWRHDSTPAQEVGKKSRDAGFVAATKQAHRCSQASMELLEEDYAYPASQPASTPGKTPTTGQAFDHYEDEGTGESTLRVVVENDWKDYSFWELVDAYHGVEDVDGWADCMVEQLIARKGDAEPDMILLVQLTGELKSSEKRLEVVEDALQAARKSRAHCTEMCRTRPQSSETIQEALYRLGDLQGTITSLKKSLATREAEVLEMREYRDTILGHVLATVTREYRGAATEGLLSASVTGGSVRVSQTRASSECLPPSPACVSVTSLPKSPSTCLASPTPANPRLAALRDLSHGSGRSSPLSQYSQESWMQKSTPKSASKVLPMSHRPKPLDKRPSLDSHCSSKEEADYSPTSGPRVTTASEKYKNKYELSTAAPVQISCHSAEAVVLDRSKSEHGSSSLRATSATLRNSASLPASSDARIPLQSGSSYEPTLCTLSPQANSPTFESPTPRVTDDQADTLSKEDLWKFFPHLKRLERCPNRIEVLDVSDFSDDDELKYGSDSSGDITVAGSARKKKDRSKPTFSRQGKCRVRMRDIEAAQKDREKTLYLDKSLPHLPEEARDEVRSRKTTFSSRAGSIASRASSSTLAAGTQAARVAGDSIATAAKRASSLVREHRRRVRMSGLPVVEESEASFGG